MDLWRWSLCRAIFCESLAKVCWCIQIIISKQGGLHLFWYRQSFLDWSNHGFVNYWLMAPLKCLSLINWLVICFMHIVIYFDLEGHAIFCAYILEAQQKILYLPLPTAVPKAHYGGLMFCSIFSSNPRLCLLSCPSFPAGSSSDYDIPNSKTHAQTYRSQASHGVAPVAPSWWFSIAPVGGCLRQLLSVWACLMFLSPCVAFMRQKIVLQDEREQLERFTNSVRYLMIVESMKENDATAEVLGSETWGVEAIRWVRTVQRVDDEPAEAASD